MRIDIAIVVAQLFHELGGRVAQMERHVKIARGPHIFQSGIDAHVGRVALLACGQIDRGLSQRDAPLGPTYFLHSIKGCVGDEQRVGIGQADVFRRADHEAAGDCGVPQEQPTTADEASPEALRRFTLAQYRFWTEDGFAVRVRRMLCLEQFRSREMNALYQSMLVGGPVAYVQALLEGMMRAGRLREGDAHALAVAYYAPMLLMILMSDSQDAVPESAALLERHIDRFMEEHAI